MADLPSILLAVAISQIRPHQEPMPAAHEGNSFATCAHRLHPLGVPGASHRLQKKCTEQVARWEHAQIGIVAACREMHRTKSLMMRARDAATARGSVCTRERKTHGECRLGPHGGAPEESEATHHFLQAAEMYRRKKGDAEQALRLDSLQIQSMRVAS